MAEVISIARFNGAVSCRRDEPPLALSLTGWTSDHPDEVATLAFVAAAPGDLPETLQDATVERIEIGAYRIRSGSREWTLSARSVHLHREVSTLFYQAVTPRPVPWGKRVFWRVVLGLLSNPIGRRVLIAIGRR